MKKISTTHIFSFIISSILIANTTFAENTLPLPYIEKNVCPFECCRFGTWTAKSQMNAYVTENDTSQVAFTIKPNDFIIAETGNFYIEQFGKVLITRSFLQFKKGYILLALHCVNEGDYLLWKDGTFYETDIFWNCREGLQEKDISQHFENPDPKYPAVVLKEPSMTWWVKIRNAENKTGWLKLKNTTPYCFMIEEDIEGTDACG